jgi:hypothetical protein
MNINLDPKLPMHITALFCVAVVFLAFHIGYDRKERAFVKEQKRLFREQERQAPRAKRTAL